MACKGGSGHGRGCRSGWVARRLAPARRRSQRGSGSVARRAAPARARRQRGRGQSEPSQSPAEGNGHGCFEGDVRAQVNRKISPEVQQTSSKHDRTPFRGGVEQRSARPTSGVKKMRGQPAGAWSSGASAAPSTSVAQRSAALKGSGLWTPGPKKGSQGVFSGHIGHQRFR